MMQKLRDKINNSIAYEIGLIEMLNNDVINIMFFHRISHLHLR